MNNTVRIGIVGDFNTANRTHRATNEAIHHAADSLAMTVEIGWLPTPTLLSGQGKDSLEQSDGLWASPGSPYQSKEGALAAIRFARERGRPFVGT